MQLTYRRIRDLHPSLKYPSGNDFQSRASGPLRPLARLLLQSGGGNGNSCSMLEPAAGVTPGGPRAGADCGPGTLWPGLLSVLQGVLQGAPDQEMIPAWARDKFLLTPQGNPTINLGTGFRRRKPTQRIPTRTSGRVRGFPGGLATQGGKVHLKNLEGTA